MRFFKNNMQWAQGSVNTAVSAPVEYVTTGSEYSIPKIWYAGNGSLVAYVPKHIAGIIRTVFGWNGKYIVTAAENDTVNIWQAGNRKLVAGFTGTNKSDDLTMPPLTPMVNLL